MGDGFHPTGFAGVEWFYLADPPKSSSGDAKEGAAKKVAWKSFKKKKVFNSVCFEAGEEECDDLVEIDEDADDGEDQFEEARAFIEGLLTSENLYEPSGAEYAPTHVISLVQK